MVYLRPSVPIFKMFWVINSRARRHLRGRKNMAGFGERELQVRFSERIVSAVWFEDICTVTIKRCELINH